MLIFGLCRGLGAHSGSSCISNCSTGLRSSSSLSGFRFIVTRPHLREYLRLYGARIALTSFAIGAPQPPLAGHHFVLYCISEASTLSNQTNSNIGCRAFANGWYHFIVLYGTKFLVRFMHKATTQAFHVRSAFVSGPFVPFVSTSWPFLYGVLSIAVSRHAVFISRPLHGRSSSVSCPFRKHFTQTVPRLFHVRSRIVHDRFANISRHRFSSVLLQRLFTSTHCPHMKGSCLFHFCVMSDCNRRTTVSDRFTSCRTTPFRKRFKSR